MTCRTDVTKKYDGPKEWRKLKIKNWTEGVNYTSHLNVSFHSTLNSNDWPYPRDGHATNPNMTWVKDSLMMSKNWRSVQLTMIIYSTFWKTKVKWRNSSLGELSLWETSSRGTKTSQASSVNSIPSCIFLTLSLDLKGKGLYDKTRRFREALAVSRATNAIKTSCDSIFSIINHAIIDIPQFSAPNANPEFIRGTNLRRKSFSNNLKRS